MSKRLSLILLAICFVAITNAQTKTKSSKSGKETPQSTTTGEKKIKYRLVVSFISHAGGIDGAKFDAMEAHIKNHAKKPAFDIIRMGREGERDICMQLKEFDAAGQKAFIEELKKVAEGSDRVKFSENEERVKKQ